MRTTNVIRIFASGGETGSRIYSFKKYHKTANH